MKGLYILVFVLIIGALGHFTAYSQDAPGTIPNTSDTTVANPKGPGLAPSLSNIVVWAYSGIAFGKEAGNVFYGIGGGYFVQEHVILGIGIEQSHYPNITVDPLYFRAQVGLLDRDRRVNPFLLGDIGYGFARKWKNAETYVDYNSIKGGVFWQLGGGVQLRLLDKVELGAGYSYRTQVVKSNYSLNYNPWWYLGNPDSSIGENYQIDEKRQIRRGTLFFSVSFRPF